MKIRDYLSECKKKKDTIVMLADTVGVLDGGKPWAAGKAEKLLKQKEYEEYLNCEVISWECWGEDSMCLDFSSKFDSKLKQLEEEKERIREKE